MVGRLAMLLRAVGDHEPRGASTTEIARQAGLPRPTVHRILGGLFADGLVDREERSGRWRLGPEVYILGSLAAERYDISDIAIDLLQGLARDTGESAFLSARRGDQSVCIVGEEGSFPLRSHVLHPGIRFPLGVASAGLVILAHLPDRELDEYLRRTDLTQSWGQSHRAVTVRERIDQTRLDGYAVNPALLVEGSWGVGAAVFDRRGHPAWALSLTGVETRFSQNRLPALGKTLLRSAHALTQRLRQKLPDDLS